MAEYHYPRFEFMTINQAADAVGLPRHFVRRAQKLGKIPGFYSGTRFYVNMKMFTEKLNKDMADFCGMTPNMFTE